MKKYLLTLICVVLSMSAYSAIGLKLSQILPRGDIGSVFKKNVEYELYYLQENFQGKLRGRVGLFYTSLKPRLDTFPIYELYNSPATGKKTFSPGYLSYHKFQFYGLFIDYSYRVFRVKGFSFYIGAGLGVGYMDEVYDYGIQSLIISNGVKNSGEIYALRTTAQVYYNLTDHIKLGLEVMNNMMTGEKWRGNYTHRMLGLNVCYNFKSYEEE